MVGKKGRRVVVMGRCVGFGRDVGGARVVSQQICPSLQLDVFGTMTPVHNPCKIFSIQGPGHFGGCVY